MHLKTWLTFVSLGAIYALASYYSKPPSICNHPGLQFIEKKQSITQVEGIMGQAHKSGENNSRFYVADNYSGQIQISFDDEGKVLQTACGESVGP